MPRDLVGEKIGRNDREEVHAELERLAWLLRHKKAWPANFRWNYNHVLEPGFGIDPKTGHAVKVMIGCALGLDALAYRGGDDSRKDYHRALGDEAYDRIFRGFYDGKGKPKPVTPWMVAREIEKYLHAARREAQERRSASRLARGGRAILDALDGLARRLQTG